MDIWRIAKKHKITHFRGTYMRDKMPKKPLRNECAVVNIDKYTGPGTHWVAYCKKNNEIFYFDSFGALPPCKELVQYFNSGIDKPKIYYNYASYQKYDTVICGHLCMSFLNHFKKYYE